MEFVQGEEMLEPMSPNAQYLISSAVSVTIIAVLESETPIDDSMVMLFIKDDFLPLNSRFSSIMVTSNEGVKKWKKVDVNLKDHVKIPTFPSGMSVEYYDKCLTEYLSQLGTEQFPQTKPLWEIHIIKYPTKNAAGNVIFKLHHSLGDGYSLMGVLLSSFKRAENPLLPLSFPTRKSTSTSDTHGFRFFGDVPKFFTGLFYTAYDLGWTIFKSSLIEDDKSPIRSGEDGVEFLSFVSSSITFSMDQIKKIKNELKVTVNDVITGIIFMGSRLYTMQETNYEKSGEAQCTALVVLNTRATGGYKPVKEMIKQDAKMPWGNHIAFLPIPIPKLTKSELENPIEFVAKAHEKIKRQRKSSTVYVTTQLLELIGKVGGPEASGRYNQRLLKNASMTISNMIGPLEQMALGNHPIKGLYWLSSGLPQSLNISVISYLGMLRVVITAEKDFIDLDKFKSCIEYAFEAISEATLDSPNSK